MPSVTGQDTFTRGRDVAMTVRDELAFSRVLRECDPNAGFQMRTPLPHSWHVSHDDPDFDGEYGAYFPFEQNEKDRERNWLLETVGLHASVRGVSLSFRRSHWSFWSTERKWAFDSPVLDWGNIYVRYMANGDEDLARYAMKILRLLNKVTWKRSKVGLDAARWSQMGQPTVRNGIGNGELIGPAKRIELNKYYDDDLWDDRLPVAALDEWHLRGRNLQ